MINIAQGREKINSKGGNILIGTQFSSIGLEKNESFDDIKNQIRKIFSQRHR